MSEGDSQPSKVEDTLERPGSPKGEYPEVNIPKPTEPPKAGSTSTHREEVEPKASASTPSKGELSGMDMMMVMMKGISEGMSDMHLRFSKVEKELDDIKSSKSSSSKPQSPQVPLASQAVSVPKRKDKVTDATQGVSSGTWANDNRKVAAVSSKDKPKSLLDLCKDVVCVRAMANGKGGANSSTHYPLRSLKKDVVGSDIDTYPDFADSNNSLPCSHYCVDAEVDIQSSRLKSRKLDESGYYELSVALPKEPQLRNVVETEEFVLRTLPGDGSSRCGIWLSGEDSYTLSVRVFEKIKPKKGESSKVSHAPNVDIIMVDSNGVHTPLTTSDDAYRRFAGAARVVFTPSVATVVTGYKKIVYKCTSLILRQGSTRVKGGITLGQQAKPSTDAEWDKMLAVIKKLTDAGVTVSTIANHLVNTIKPNEDKKSKSQKQATKSQKVEEKESESEEEESDGEEEEESSSEEEEELPKPKPKAKKQSPSMYVLDPPGASSKGKAKFPAK